MRVTKKECRTTSIVTGFVHPEKDVDIMVFL